MLSTHHIPSRRGRLLAAAPILLSGALLLAACGGGSSKPSTSATTVSGGTTATTAAGGTSGGNTASELQAFGSNVKSASNATFKAVYTATSDGSTQTITLEQAPPKQLFMTSGGSSGTSEFLNTGTTTYECSSGTCTNLGSSGLGGALSSIIDLYNGTTALTTLDGWESIVAAHVAGVSLSFSNDTIAGQSVKCADWSYQGQSDTYCVTSSGVLAKVASSGSSFELTSFSTSAPGSDFAVPAGSTTQTLPSGVTIP